MNSIRVGIHETEFSHLGSERGKASREVLKQCGLTFREDSYCGCVLGP